jgi:predicted phage replisome organizer
MSDNKKYYYMKLKDNFFNQDEIKFIESHENGHEYVNILLKLYLTSLKNKGFLRMGTIPMDYKMISSVTGSRIEVVSSAIESFKRLGLVDIVDGNEIYMSDIELFIGKSSTEGERKKRARIDSRNKANNNTVLDICPPDIRDKRLENRDKNNKYISSIFEEKEKSNNETDKEHLTTNASNVDKQEIKSTPKKDNIAKKNKYSDKFCSIWESYEKKGNKKKSYEQYNKLSLNEKEKLVLSIGLYKKERPERIYRKDLERYIRDREFESVIERSAYLEEKEAVPKKRPAKEKGLRQVIKIRVFGNGEDPEIVLHDLSKSYPDVDFDREVFFKIVKEEGK